MRNKASYMLTRKGCDQGEVLIALYKADRFLSVEELMSLSKQDRSTVLEFLKTFQQDGAIEQLTDDEKWGIARDVRSMLEKMLLRNGWML